MLGPVESSYFRSLSAVGDDSDDGDDDDDGDGDVGDDALC